MSMEDSIKKIEQEVLSSKEIKAFIDENKIDAEVFSRNLSFFYQQQQAEEKCKICKGKKTCLLDPAGYKPVLEYNHGNINQKLIRCPYLEVLNEDLLDMMFFPNIYVEGDITVTKERGPLLSSIKEYMKNPKINKGFYLHGSFGTGKTFILIKLAREIIKKGIKVTFVYYPDLVRSMKSSITNGGIEELVMKLKNIEVLMLDDIGGENNTSFVRDEVLGPILQYRSLANLPTFMTSNLNINELREHFMETRDGIDAIKSQRIIERVKFLMKDIELIGTNFR